MGNDTSTLRSGAVRRSPRPEAKVIKSASVMLSNKRIYLDVIENPRGLALRITEKTDNFRNTIIIPSEGVNDFAAALDEVFYEVGGKDPE